MKKQKKITKRELRLEINKLMKTGKNRHIIYNEFDRQGISVSRPDVYREVDMIKEIAELLRKGYSGRQIIRKLRDKGYNFDDKDIYEIINTRKKPVKKKERKYVCLKEVKVRDLYEEEYDRILEIPIRVKKKKKEVIDVIKKYKFSDVTEYERIKIEPWHCKSKNKYILTYSRLLSMYYIIFTRLRIIEWKNILNVTDYLLGFYTTATHGNKKAIDFLREVYDLIEEKEKELYENKVEEKDLLDEIEEVFGDEEI